MPQRDRSRSSRRARSRCAGSGTSCFGLGAPRAATEFAMLVGVRSNGGDPGAAQETDSVRALPDTAEVHVVVSAPSGISITPIPKREIVRIRRAPGCHIVIGDDPASLVHALIPTRTPPAP